MYRVIHDFNDAQDGEHWYKVGDIYPREGKKTTLERATELMGEHNRIGKPLIEDVPEAEEAPKKKVRK